MTEKSVMNRTSLVQSTVFFSSPFKLDFNEKSTTRERAIHAFRHLVTIKECEGPPLSENCPYLYPNHTRGGVELPL